MNMTVTIPEQYVDVDIDGVVVPTYNSLAGSDEQYFGTDNFRARKLGGGMVRIHVRQGVIRHRDEYVAMDLPLAEVLKAIALAG
jgi:hypothetical protein